MATAKLFAATGDFKNDIQLPALFDEEVNKVCMYLHIKAILNNARQGTAQTKNKSSVSGGGQKPWKQKGTGRARSGQNTSAVWVRGAKAHGPKSHDYFEKVNKKVKKIAFHSALATKARSSCSKLSASMPRRPRTSSLFSPSPVSNSAMCSSSRAALTRTCTFLPTTSLGAVALASKT